MKTQKELLLEALENAGMRGLTPMDILKLGIYRASARIMELRRAGYLITTIKNGKSRLARYIYSKEKQGILI